MGGTAIVSFVKHNNEIMMMMMMMPSSDLAHHNDMILCVDFEWIRTNNNTCEVCLSCDGMSWW